MNIEIFQKVEGAKQAQGLTIIIDVFRAFTLEACLYKNKCKKIYACKDIETAYKLKEKYPNSILIGERNGKKIDGFDYGNSPSIIKDIDFSDKVVIHTTTNGTNGLANANNSDELITGSLVNAKAIAKYIKDKNPCNVSLVCMGWQDRETEEDTLCAEYIKSLLLDEYFDIESKAMDLKNSEGKKFFDPCNQDIFPREDFYECIRVNSCDFVIKCYKEEDYFRNEMISNG